MRFRRNWSQDTRPPPSAPSQLEGQRAAGGGASVSTWAAFSVRCFIHKNGSYSGPGTTSLALKICSAEGLLSFLVIAKPSGRNEGVDNR